MRTVWHEPTVIDEKPLGWKGNSVTPSPVNWTSIEGARWFFLEYPRVSVRTATVHNARALRVDDFASSTDHATGAGFPEEEASDGVRQFGSGDPVDGVEER